MDGVQIWLCFQPELDSALLTYNIAEFIFVSSKPFSDRPVRGIHAGPTYPQFVRRLVSFYQANDFYLESTVPCAPCNPDVYRRVRCCGAKVPKDPHCRRPHKFVFVHRGGMRISHYISSGFPDHLSYDLLQDVQRATGLYISRRWKPPAKLFDLRDDPTPLRVVNRV